MKLKKKRFLSILLSLALAIGMMPAMTQMVMADESMGDKGTWGGDPYANLVSTTDTVKFNNMDWYVVSDESTAQNSGTLTLLAKDPIANSQWAVSGHVYDSSTVRDVLLDKESTDFVSVARAMKAGYALGSSSPKQERGKLHDKIWLLSAREAKALPAAVRKCSADWWLRTGSYDSGSYVSYVKADGSVVSADDTSRKSHNGKHISENLAVRPAVKIDLSTLSYDSSTKTFTLSNTPAVTGIQMSVDDNSTSTAWNLYTGSTRKIKVTLSPDNAADKTVTWSFDKNNYVKLYADEKCTIEVPTNKPTNVLTVYAWGAKSAPVIIGGETYYDSIVNIKATSNSSNQSKERKFTVKPMNPGYPAHNPVSMPEQQNVNVPYSASAQSAVFTTASKLDLFNDFEYSVKSQKDASGNDVNYFGLDDPKSRTPKLTIAKGTPAGTYSVVASIMVYSNNDFSGDMKDTTLTVNVLGDDSGDPIETKPSSVSYLQKSWDEGSKSVKSETRSCTNFNKINPDTTYFDDGEWYVVTKSVKVDDLITVTGNANLIIMDDQKLEAVEGINVKKGGNLNIYVQSEGSKAGKLIATGKKIADGSFTAGISGNVIIHGGNVTATSESVAAGIGGSFINGSGGNGGNVTIYAGTVTAKADSYGAGIGGSSGGNGGKVTVYGGKVTATSGVEAAGIGGGMDASGGEFTIYGGTVVAKGVDDGAGIGGGYYSEGGKLAKGGPVNIYGGTVIATSANGSGAGIGGGTAYGNCDGGDVNITGGVVYAYGSRGIGYGSRLVSGVSTPQSDGKLTLGEGVKLETSSDGETWTQTTDTTARPKYMRVNYAKYPLWVGGTQVDGVNAPDPGDRGWDYDDASKTLTLKDCKIDKGYEFDSKKAAIYANQDLTIQLEGDSNVALEDGYGIYVDGSGNALTIKGDGALTVAGGTKAIEGSVKNEIPGTGWTDFDGKEGKTDIPVSTTGQDLTYKKAHFELVPAPEPSNTPAQESTTQKDQPKAAAKGDKVAVKDGSVTITSTDAKTASFSKAANKKSVTVPDTVKVDGKVYKVTAVTAKAFAGSKATSVTLGKNIKTLKPNAFKGSKVKKVTVKTKKLKKSSVKNSLKGSKVKKIKVKVGNKKTNKKYVKKYKKIFTKKNAGKKVKVS